MTADKEPFDTRRSQQYCITVQGHLDPRWSEWFENLAITQQPDGTTTLSGSVVDQAALNGLIIKLRDKGLTLLSVQVQSAQDEDWRRESMKLLRTLFLGGSTRSLWLKTSSSRYLAQTPPGPLCSWAIMTLPTTRPGRPTIPG